MAWGPLAWVVATELSVGKNRQKIMSVGTAFFWLSAFIVTFTMPYLYDATEANLEAQIGYIYAGGSLIAMVFVYFYIPETLGRSLEEINCASRFFLFTFWNDVLIGALLVSQSAVMMDAKIPTREWATYDLLRDVKREEESKRDVQHVEHIDPKAELENRKEVV